MASPPQALDATTLPSLALREADTHRAVRAYFGVALVGAFGSCALLILGGPSHVRWPLLVAAAITASYSFWLAWTRRRQGVYSDAESTVAAVMMSVTALLATVYVGPFTVPAALLVPLMIGLAMGHPGRAPRYAAMIMVGYAAVGALSIAGYIEPVSQHLLSRGNVTFVLGVVLVEAVLGVSYFFGVTARRSTAAALEHVQRARVALAEREALLQEAFADLRRLGGGQGRLSGAQLGKNRLGDLLGRGGMGEVYRAKDLQDGVPVAVKVLHANLAADPSLVTRFFREADISSALASPHIVKVLDHGVAEDGSPYLVMELIEGQSLGAILREKTQLELSAVGKLCRHISTALSAAHAASIVHRDVKLGNVMRRDDGTWMLLDFGISRLHTGTGTLTGGSFIGTPGYMPPEQVAGMDVDGRADVFALAVVLYRALTGRLPFSGNDPLTTIYNSVQRQPLQPSMLADVPPEVDLVLAIALAKRPRDRLESARALADAFERAACGELDEDLRRRAHRLLQEMPWGDELPTQRDVSGRGEGPEGNTLIRAR